MDKRAIPFLQMLTVQQFITKHHRNHTLVTDWKARSHSDPLRQPRSEHAYEKHDRRLPINSAWLATWFRKNASKYRVSVSQCFHRESYFSCRLHHHQRQPLSHQLRSFTINFELLPLLGVRDDL